MAHTNALTRRALARVPRIPRRWLVVMCALLFVGLPYGTVASRAASTPNLAYSTSKTRTPTASLNGASVSGSIYVWASSAKSGSVASFYVDDPNRTKAPLHTDWSGPYDMVGNSGSYALPFDTKTLTNAKHTITVSLSVGSKTYAVVTSTITVSNTAETNLFGNMVPAVATDPDSGSVELGVRFTSDVAGTVNGVRFYKSATNLGTHVGNLWSATGTRLASVTFTGETTSGWQQARFSNPVPIVAGQNYVVSYLAPQGHYAGDEGWFNGRSQDVVPLHAPANGSGGLNGLYKYGLTSSFPTDNWNGANFYVDVIFAPSFPTASPGATTTTTAPAGGTTSTTVAPAPTTTTAPATTTTTAPPPPPTVQPDTSVWPGPANTGVPAGTALTTVNSDIVVTTPGTVIDGVYLSGHCISIQADNVTVRRSKIVSPPSCASQHQIDVGWGHTGILIQDVEIDGMNASSSGAAIGDEGFTCSRCNIHNVGQGVHMNYGTLIDSWIHDIYEAGGSHNEDFITNGMGTAAPKGTTLIKHNFLQNANGQTSTISLFANFDPVHDVTIDGNLLAGGGYMIYGGCCDRGVWNITVTNNFFSRMYFPNGGQWGPVTNWDSSAPGMTWANNVWADTGALITP